MIESLSFDCQILPDIANTYAILADDTHLSVGIEVKMDNLIDLSLIDSN